MLCVSLSTNSTEFQFMSPPMRPIPFFMTKFLCRALKLFWDITKKSLISVIIPMWSRRYSLKLDKSVLQKRTAGPKVYQRCPPSACSVNTSSHLGDKSWCMAFLLLYVIVFERREKFLARMLRKALSWAHLGGLPSMARADKNYWSSQTLAQ